MCPPMKFGTAIGWNAVPGAAHDEHETRGRAQIVSLLSGVVLGWKCSCAVAPLVTVRFFSKGAASRSRPSCLPVRLHGGGNYFSAATFRTNQPAIYQSPIF